MTMPITTAIVAAIIIILQQILMILVGRHRIQTNANIGFGEDRDLERKIRRHANLAENAGLFVAVLAIAEIVGAPAVFIATVGAVFVIARLAHAFAFSSNVGSHGEDGNRIFIAARVIGAFGSFLSSLVLGAYLLYFALQL